VGRDEEAVNISSVGYDEGKCKGHALFVAGKALRNFR
jgi:hypothetical protein